MTCPYTPRKPAPVFGRTRLLPVYYVLHADLLDGLYYWQVTRVAVNVDEPLPCRLNLYHHDGVNQMATAEVECRPLRAANSVERDNWRVKALALLGSLRVNFPQRLLDPRSSGMYELTGMLRA